MSAEWIAVSNALAEATETAVAHVVAIHTEARGSSSGVIWRLGVIVTAEHALRRDEEIHVTLADGKIVPAKVIGRDPSTDVAVLVCEEARTAATLGKTESLKPGNIALVVGRTRASGPVAALAFVSLVVKERRMWGGTSVAPYVRLDVALQRTGVGGAVVDAGGQIVALATPKFSPGGALALPVSVVNRVVDALLEKGRIARGYLGVGLQPIRLPEKFARGAEPQRENRRDCPGSAAGRPGPQGRRGHRRHPDRVEWRSGATSGRCAGPPTWRGNRENGKGGVSARWRTPRRGNCHRGAAKQRRVAPPEEAQATESTQRNRGGCCNERTGVGRRVG